jgi:hypothetical protein
MKCLTKSELRELLVAARKTLRRVTMELSNSNQVATAQRERAIKAERLLELSEKGYKAEIKKLQDRIEFEDNCG